MASTPTTRKRSILYFRLPAKSETVYNGSVIQTTNRVSELYGTQETVSEGHPFRRNKSKGMTDLGGNFYTRKTSWSDGRPSDANRIYSNVYGSGTTRYPWSGPLFPTAPGTRLFPDLVDTPTGVLYGLGSTAISRVKPTNSVADLATALGETMREGIPKMIGSELWKSRTKSLRDISRAGGSEYLNVQFGWAPLVSDIKKAAYAASKSEEILRQYKRDSGKLVRRRYEFPTEIDESVVRVDEGIVPFSPALYHTSTIDQRGVLTLSRKVERRRWFSGAFTYYVPVDKSRYGRLVEQAAEARKLYGLTIDPEVLWNLTPWSWAADWIFNTGDILSNVSDAITDGLVMRYGYLMEHSIISDTYTLAGFSIRGVPETVLTNTYSTETKRRIRATPYGFGLSWDGFSPYQLSILAALGVSRR